MNTRLRTLSIAIPLSILVGCGASNRETPNGVTVANTSGVSVTSAAIVDSEDKPLYEGSLSCASGNEACGLALPEVSAEAVLVVRDSAGRVVGAQPLPDGVEAGDAVYLSDAGTGAYLAKKLVKAMSALDITEDSVYLRLGNFFENYVPPNGFLDIKEALARYYLLRVQATRLTDLEILDRLKQRLVDWEVAEAAEFQPLAMRWWQSLYASLMGTKSTGGIELIRSAHAAGNCSQGGKDAVAVLYQLSNSIPKVGGALGATFGIAKHFCDNTTELLKEVLTQLKTLRASVNAMQGQLGRFFALYSDNTVREQDARFQSLAVDAKNFRRQYDRFLQDNGGHATLEQYFRRAGGWEAGILRGGVRLQEILRSPTQAAGSLDLTLTRFSAVTNDALLRTFFSSLNSRCAQFGFLEQDQLFVRAQCNNTIAAGLAYLIAAQGLVLPIFNDVYKVLDTYRNVVVNGTPVANSYPLPGQVSSFAQGAAQIRLWMEDLQGAYVNLAKASTTGRDAQNNPTGLFDPYFGLNATLMRTMRDRNCAMPGNPGLPAITGIFLPNGEETSWHIATFCRVGTENRRIHARYWHRSQGGADVNDVSNVLGVLVARRHTNDWWMFGNSSGSYTYASSVDGYAVNSPLVVAVNSQQLRRAGGREEEVVSEGFGGQWSRDRGVLRRDASTNRISAQVSGHNVGGIYNYNWVAFRGNQKDDDGNYYHQVIYLVLGGRDGRNYAYGYAYCMTKDCTVTNSYSLKFERGPQAVNFFNREDAGWTNFRLTLD